MQAYETTFEATCKTSCAVISRLLTRGLSFQPTPSNFTRRHVFKFHWSNKNFEVWGGSYKPPVHHLCVWGSLCAPPPGFGTAEPWPLKGFPLFWETGLRCHYNIVNCGFLKIKSSYPIQSGANNCAFGDDVLWFLYERLNSNFKCTSLRQFWSIVDTLGKSPTR